jgi:hypothetical protein
MDAAGAGSSGPLIGYHPGFDGRQEACLRVFCVSVLILPRVPTRATCLVQLLDLLVVDQDSGKVVDLDAVVDSQTRTQGRTHEIPAVGTPLAVDRIRRLERRHLLERLTVVDVDLASQVTEPGNAEEAALRVVREEVARVQAKVVDHLDASIKDDGLCRHICGHRTRVSALREKREQSARRGTYSRR